jgi:hypothetical protein
MKEAATRYRLENGNWRAVRQAPAAKNGFIIALLAAVAQAFLFPAPGARGGWLHRDVLNNIGVFKFRVMAEAEQNLPVFPLACLVGHSSLRRNARRQFGARHSFTL